MSSNAPNVEIHSFADSKHKIITDAVALIHCQEHLGVQVTSQQQ